MRFTVLGVSMLLAIAGCGRRGHPGTADAGAPTAPGCPAAPLIEALHAATFHLEHRDLAAARASIARARRLFDRAPGEPTAAKLLADLERIAAGPGDLERAQYEADQVRFALTEWRCLTPELHARFHAALPPI
jgi:hypothetical protein